MTNDSTLVEMLDDADPVEQTEETTAAPRPTQGGRIRRLLTWFNKWRRRRPFWGVLVMMLGAYFIANPIVSGGFAFVADMGPKAFGPLGIGFGIAMAGLVALFAPSQRHFPALIAAGLSVASLPMANLGGWLIGMLLGIVGASLTFAWTPYSEKQLARYAKKAERKAARREAARAAKLQQQNAGSGN